MAMSTESAALKKPKRPLSGYNLFYRYKRNKVVEATARPDHDNEANIRAVLTALPGLEDVPPASPLLGLPPDRLNEFRAAAIRDAMEGKLFPNENGRDRVHCKVHGMGFVEMGKMVRQTWGRADKLTKDVFNDLADVGRVRYRKLAARYKLKCEIEERKVAEESVRAASQPSSASDPMLEALSAWSTKNPPAVAAEGASPPEDRWTSLLADLQRRCDADAEEGEGEGSPPPAPAADGSRPFVPHQARTLGRDRGDLFGPLSLADAADFGAPVPRRARAFGRGRGDLFDPLSFDATMNAAAGALAPADGVPGTAAGLDLRDVSFFDPLPVEGAGGPVAARDDGPRRGRRVSAKAAELDLRDASLYGAAMAAFDNDAAKDDGPRQGRRVSAKAADLDLYEAAKNEAPRPGRRVSAKAAELVHRDVSRFESPPVEEVTSGVAIAPHDATFGVPPNRAEKSGGPRQGRRVSAKAAELNLANTDLESLKTTIEQQVSLRIAMKNIKDQIMQNNSLLPSDMRVFPKEDDAPRERAVGSPSGNAEATGNNGPEERGASARDFAELFDVLDEAIDDPGTDAGAHVIFGKPVYRPSFDFGYKPVSPLQFSIPMPADIELRNNRARMA